MDTSVNGQMTSAVNSITKYEIIELKSMKVPPPLIQLVFTAVCNLLNIKPDRIADPDKPGKKVNSFE
jgi:dynein heavy chain